MKILHTVQRYAPDTGGSEEVVKQLSEYLVSFGHQVTVATSKSPRREGKMLNGVTIEDFNCSGNIVEGIRGDAREYVEFIRSADVDVIMNYAAQIWSSDLVFDLLPSLDMKMFLVPCGYSRLRDPAYAEYFRNMPGILRQYNKVIYLSENYIDKHFADKHGLNNGVVIPNGADAREFAQAEKGVFRQRHNLNGRRIVLNVSNHSLLKNHSFFWNCVRMLKRDNIAPVLIGNAYVTSPKKWLTECYTECRLNGLRYHVPVLEHFPRRRVIEAFLDADIFLFGSKVECSPLVMFEAFAGRTLFITTNCGNVKDYADVVCVVDNEKEAVEVIEHYSHHPEEYRNRIDNGFQYSLRHLNWEAIARQYERLYRETC